MSFVNAQPAEMVAAAGGLQGIGSAMMASSAAAAEPTTGVVPPAADPTSFLLAAAFGVHGGLFQGVSAVGDAVHEGIVTTLGASSASYAATEAINDIAAAI